jgi:myosin-crossreactive antigen
VPEVCGHARLKTLRKLSSDNYECTSHPTLAGVAQTLSLNEDDLILAHQPHFAGQPDGVPVFWGYGLFQDRVGNFVAKRLSHRTGRLRAS